MTGIKLFSECWSVPSKSYGWPSGSIFWSSISNLQTVKGITSWLAQPSIEISVPTNSRNPAAAKSGDSHVVEQQRPPRQHCFASRLSRISFPKHDPASQSLEVARFSRAGHIDELISPCHLFTGTESNGRPSCIEGMRRWSARPSRTFVSPLRHISTLLTIYFWHFYMRGTPLRARETGGLSMYPGGGEIRCPPP